ncbi:hypothetical protein [Butyrivibrio sp. WCD3002]|uniref:hypothetical protein n=1 Tax=Butyrivibrio sp. WCD3002 TaxID=1280676 RepID=UPI00040092FE|nr:hypothetical protein [Butyrivibrio sp. WCD3002]
MHGTKPWDIDTGAPALSFAYMFAEDGKKYKTGKDVFIYVGINAYWEEQTFELPVLPEKYKWYLAFEAYGFSADVGKEEKLGNQSSITLGPRSSMILVGKK